MRIQFHAREWHSVEEEIVDKHLLPACQELAAKCNIDAGLDNQGYIADVDTVGEGVPLRLHAFRATVITRTRAAKLDNIAYARLITNFYLVEAALR
jgi:hypothetical protein